MELRLDFAFTLAYLLQLGCFGYSLAQQPCRRQGINERGLTFQKTVSWSQRTRGCLGCSLTSFVTWAVRRPCKRCAT